jgi:predicted transcriptional regulator
MANDAGIAKMTEELVAIKKLLVYALLENGMSQEAVAAALGKDQSYVSRMFGKGGVTKRASRGRKKENTEAAGAGDGD